MRYVLALSICLCSIASAQSSPSYRLEESTMNAGGHPRNGIGLSSANYRMSLDAIGETPIAPVLFSTAYSMDVGFARCFPPPREVQQITVLDKTMFAWTPERSVGTYRVYRATCMSCPLATALARSRTLASSTSRWRKFPTLANSFSIL